MPAKRPAPLSDELLNPAAQAAASVLGAPNNGMPLPVKNTFIDVPSGLTPSNMKLAAGAKLPPAMTAPPDLSRPGVFQRAMIGSTVIVGPAPQSPARAANTTVRVVGQTTVTPSFLTTATPSPTSGAAALAQWSTGLQTRPVASSAYTALPGGPLTFALTPTSARAMGLQASPSGNATTVLYGPTLHYNRPAAAAVQATQLEQVADVPDDDEDSAQDDDSDDMEHLVPQHFRNSEDVPKPPPGAAHPSKGSEAHATGNCKRCCFFPRGRCTNGYECEFCHYEHEKRKRKNKKKHKKDGLPLTSVAGKPLDRLVLLPTAPTTVMYQATPMRTVSPDHHQPLAYPAPQADGSPIRYQPQWAGQAVQPAPAASQVLQLQPPQMQQVPVPSQATYSQPVTYPQPPPYPSQQAPYAAPPATYPSQQQMYSTQQPNYTAKPVYSQPTGYATQQVNYSPPPSYTQPQPMMQTQPQMQQQMVMPSQQGQYQGQQQLMPLHQPQMQPMQQQVPLQQMYQQPQAMGQGQPQLPPSFGVGQVVSGQDMRMLPPGQLAPLHNVLERTPPPPMQSPKLRQAPAFGPAVALGGPLQPPPISSPKFTRPMMPGQAMQGYQVGGPLMWSENPAEVGNPAAQGQYYMPYMGEGPVG